MITNIGFEYTKTKEQWIVCSRSSSKFYICQNDNKSEYTRNVQNQFDQSNLIIITKIESII